MSSIPSATNDSESISRSALPGSTCNVPLFPLPYYDICKYPSLPQETMKRFWNMALEEQGTSKNMCERTLILFISVDYSQAHFFWVDPCAPRGVQSAACHPVFTMPNFLVLDNGWTQTFGRSDYSGAGVGNWVHAKLR